MAYNANGVISPDKVWALVKALNESSGYITGRIFFTSCATVSFSSRTQVPGVSYFLLPTMLLPHLQFHYHVFGPWPVPVSEVHLLLDPVTTVFTSS